MVYSGEKILDVEVDLQGEAYIALCDLLKLAGWCDSGGQAKTVIAAGEVWRNGQIETRKTAKICAGEVIEFAGATMNVVDSGNDADE